MVRVLILEDEALIAMLLEDLVREFGFDAHAYGTSDDALAALDTLRFDMAILDVNLGTSLSYPVADALVARGIPFAFATGYGSGGVDPKYRGVAVMRKPIERGSLRTVIEQLSPPLPQHAPE
jgi:CheY-like chemotaxis protein